jgi:hypothetical protein
MDDGSQNPRSKMVGVAEGRVKGIVGVVADWNRVALAKV